MPPSAGGHPAASNVSGRMDADGGGAPGFDSTPRVVPIRRELRSKETPHMTRLLPALFLLIAGLARADEGMWTFNNFPSDLVNARYGFSPSQEWLTKVQLSAARVAGGCSASFVSPTGLVMTNHHCVRDCAQQLSTAQND